MGVEKGGHRARPITLYRDAQTIIETSGKWDEKRKAEIVQELFGY